MSPQHHCQHHRGRHDERYCLVNGWADLVCDYFRFWRVLERLIERPPERIPRGNDRIWMKRFGRTRYEIADAKLNFKEAQLLEDE